MPKPLFQDIIPPDKRSIKKIPVPARRAARVDEVAPASRSVQSDRRFQEFEQSERKQDRTYPSRPPMPRVAPMRVVPPREAQPMVEPRHYDRPHPFTDSRDIEVANDGADERAAAIAELRRLEKERESASLREARAAQRAVAYDEPVRRPRQRRGLSKRSWILLLILLIIIGGVLFLTYWAAGATVTIEPRSQKVSVDAQFTAVKDSGEPKAAGLTYQSVTFSKDGTLIVPATGEKQTDIKATGKIIIYNNYSSASQKLIASTRFETPQGLIFRITSPVTVPGKTTDEEGKAVPGSVEATVVADAAGAKYNIGLTDFTIPGFKGDPRYTGFYARSKTATEGGYSGIRKTVESAASADAEAKIKTSLETAAIQQAKKDIPAGYTMPTGAYMVEYQRLPDVPTSSGVTIAVRATFHGIIFKTSDLAESISGKSGSSAIPASIAKNALGLDGLTFILKSPAWSSTSTSTSAGGSAGAPVAPWAAPQLVFGLQGTTTLIADIKTADLKAELAGKPRKNLNAILATHPEVAKAEVAFKPFWKNEFPTNQERIIVTTKSENLGQ